MIECDRNIMYRNMMQFDRNIMYRNMIQCERNIMYRNMIQCYCSIMYANMTQFDQNHNRRFFTDDCVGERYCSWPWAGCGMHPCARDTVTVPGIWAFNDKRFFSRGNAN